MEFYQLTAHQLLDKLKSKEITSEQVYSSLSRRIKETESKVKAYVRLDEAGSPEEDKGAGIPVSIKDNICTKGNNTECCSKILKGFKPPYDATVITRLKDSGLGVFSYKTNMDEFAFGSSTENSCFGPTRNPWNTECVPGGSSGGSAAAVAADEAILALGSDTGGSIRQPASFCGVVGLKPTYGAVSRYGLIADASSLDQIGPITKSVEDAEIIFNIIKGKDEMDSTSVEFNPPLAEKSKNSLRIGLLKYDRKGVDKEVNDAIDLSIRILRQLGHKVEETEMSHIEYSLPCYYIIQPAEASANLARFDGVKYGLSISGKNLLEDYMKTRAEGFGKEVKRRIMLGTYVLSAGYYDEYYGRAQKVRTLIKNDFKEIFNNGFDVVFSPTAPTPAFKIGEKTEDPLQMYLSDIFTVSVNLAGLPAISLPVSSSGLPIGVQFIAPWFREDLLFELGKQYEKAARS